MNLIAHFGCLALDGTRYSTAALFDLDGTVQQHYCWQVSRCFNTYNPSRSHYSCLLPKYSLIKQRQLGK